MRRTLGTAVFSGMLGVTAFGLLLTPVFYYVVERWFAAAPPPATPPEAQQTIKPAGDADGHAAPENKPVPKPG